MVGVRFSELPIPSVRHSLHTRAPLPVLAAVPYLALELWREIESTPHSFLVVRLSLLALTTLPRLPPVEAVLAVPFLRAFLALRVRVVGAPPLALYPTPQLKPFLSPLLRQRGVPHLLRPNGHFRLLPVPLLSLLARLPLLPRPGSPWVLQNLLTTVTPKDWKFK